MDFDKIVRLIIMHDMGEIETGDIVTTKKTEADTKAEMMAIKQVANKSPDFVRREIENNFHGFENPKTKEEKFVKAMDKFEGLLFWFTDDGIKMVKTFTENPDIIKYLEKLEKTLETLNFPSVLKYFKVMREDLIKRGLLV